MSRIIGIDLGTTNSCVAVVEGGEPIVIPNSEGARTTPSVVAFTEDGDRLVGQIARRQAVTNPMNTLYAVKRLIGRKYSSPEVARTAEVAPFAIVEAENGDAWVDVGGKRYSPQQISAMVLERMKETAQDYLGETITRAIVTVPAYFDDSQRQATKDAGRIAGLDVQRIINEPTAAALAYGLQKSGSEHIAVFDLGGGTFDVSILVLQDGVFEVKATNGDTFLGGEDFDHRVVEHCLATFKAETGIDLREDRMAIQRLKEAAEKAKQELSSTLETEINLPFIAVDRSGPRHLKLTLSRAKLESLVHDLIERVEGPCRKCIQDSGFKVQELDEVLLVGGMTRMPRVQQKVREIFGKEPHRGVNPDEVVAVGAAIQGSVLAGETKDVLLLDVTPLSLGIETANGVFTRLIERNTLIPTRKTEVFTTAQDNQPMVRVHVLQGEREMAADSRSLARFELQGLPPAPRGVPQIEVTFEIDANGILNVEAKDVGTGKRQSVKVVSSSGLSEAEVRRMVQEAEQHRDEDQLRRDIAEERNRLEGLVYGVERSIEYYVEHLQFEDLMALREGVAQAHEVLKTNRIDEIRRVAAELGASSEKLARAIYEGSVAQPEAIGAVEGGGEDPAK
ncbi:molecular chaperone DnaK [Myxococcota bacterium]|nr:molecular chaperone DnaK [Myxococcota bacterium]